MQTDTPSQERDDIVAVLALATASAISADEFCEDDYVHLTVSEGERSLEEIIRLRRELQAAREALRDLVADCDDYVRINNLYDGNGEPAKWATVERARAALGEGQK